MEHVGPTEAVEMVASPSDPTQLVDLYGEPMDPDPEDIPIMLALRKTAEYIYEKWDEENRLHCERNPIPTHVPDPTPTGVYTSKSLDCLLPVPEGRPLPTLSDYIQAAPLPSVDFARGYHQMPLLAPKKEEMATDDA